jgi:hypothetical protein
MARTLAAASRLKLEEDRGVGCRGCGIAGNSVLALRTELVRLEIRRMPCLGPPSMSTNQ